MLLKRIEKDGVIKAIYESSNIVASVYNTNTNEMNLIFKAGTKYKYKDVSRADYLRFELADSQGTIFNTHFKKYLHEKMGNVDITKILEESTSIKKQEYDAALAVKKEKLTKTLKGTVLLIDGGKPFVQTLEVLKKDIDDFINKLNEIEKDEVQ
jgi:hypothetical protein